MSQYLETFVYMLVLTPAFQPLENRPFGTIIFATTKHFTKRRYLFLLRQYSRVLYLIWQLRLNSCSYSTSPLSLSALSSIHRCSADDDFMYKSVCCLIWKNLFAEFMTFSAYSNGSQLPLKTVYKGHINCWVSWKSLWMGYIIFHASF